MCAHQTGLSSSSDLRVDLVKSNVVRHSRIERKVRGEKAVLHLREIETHFRMFLEHVADTQKKIELWMKACIGRGVQCTEPRCGTADCAVLQEVLY